MTGTPFPRAVRLPASLAGELWLGPMPGRLRPFDKDMGTLNAQNIDRIVSLTPLSEIEEKAPDYAVALAEGMDIAVSRFPIADFAIPDDEAGLFALAARTAGELREGSKVFVHCAAGIGRTGTMAICVLLALGLDVTEATAIVAAAGSGPETEAQKALVARCALKAQPQPAETSS